MVQAVMAARGGAARVVAVCALAAAVVGAWVAPAARGQAVARPARPATPIQGTVTTIQTTPATIPPEQVAQLKQAYDAMPPDEQAAMVATFRDMGIDLLALFGGAEGGAAPAGDAAAPAAGMTLVQAVQALNFARTPQAVLEARAKLGLQQQEMPAADAPTEDLASWLHLNVMAGEWGALDRFLRERAGESAVEIYAHVLQSTNQGDPALLPEEILAISEAAPNELTEWQLNLLAQLLKAAAARSSTGPLLEKLREGTRYFGAGDDATRVRTAKFLSAAGLAVEVFDYLPSLDLARERGDAAAMLDHARYHQARAAALGEAPQAKVHLREAWDLYGEIATLGGAEFEQRRAAIGQAVDLLHTIAPAPATEWLRGVFADPGLAPAALEAVALKAMKINDEQIDAAERASAILTMKDAVDALLADERVALDQVRVPLRMLTMSLVAAAETTIEQRSMQPGVAPEVGLLLRALPSDQWRAAIEPSLAVRAYKAFIGIAMLADNVDMALDLLAQAVERAPAQSRDLADEFLRLWMTRLNPPNPYGDDPYIFYFGRMQQASAPLTRGRQERDLDRLTAVLDLLDSIGVDGRSLDRVVEAFGACHGRAETYKRENLERVLGPVAGLDPRVSAMIADAMRTGLNGDWRSRDVQREEGTKRNEGEIRALVEEGYELALDLIDSAIAKEPGSWGHTITKTSLAYDRMQFRAEREQDAASYNAARADLFRAFEEAAAGYEAALGRGEIREDPTVYIIWFSIALGSSDLAQLTADDLLTEAAENEDQIARIRAKLMALPPDAAESHIGEFASAIVDALPSLAPEVKPGVVRRAAEIVGDHVAGAPLRQTLDLYNDLLSDEIHLHLAVDGPDRVGTEPFGAVLTLRYTTTIGRDVGGFQQYLQNGVYSFVGRQYQQINFRDRLQKSIEQAFDDDIELVKIGFFDPMNPSNPVRVDGEGGWEEKPLAYMVLRAMDPSADRLPTLQMDINLQDLSGMVVLPVRSNAVLVDASGSSGPRPAKSIEAVQVVDLREASADDPRVQVEVSVTGLGLVPELDALLAGLDSAMPGFRVDRESLEAEPIEVAGVEATDWMGFGMMTNAAKDTYIEPDDAGVFRLPTTRRWLVKYEPDGGARAAAFTVPTIAQGATATLRTEHYVDRDLVPVVGTEIPLSPRGWNPVVVVGSALVAMLVGVLGFMWVRKNAASGEGAERIVRIPDRITPLAAVVTLERISREFGDRLNAEERSKLEADVAELERSYFARNAEGNGDLAVSVVRRWAGRVGG